MAKTVLALAPDPADLGRVRSALGSRYRVWGAASEEEALRILGEGVRPQLIVCPLLFEGGDVRSFRRKVKAFPLLKRVPFLVIARETDKGREEHPLCASNLVVTQPIVEASLRRAVDSLLAVPKRF